MLIVKFLKGDGVYVVGDCTQLEDDKAAEYAKNGIVQIIDPNKVEDVTSEELQKTLPKKPEEIKNKHICAICGKEFKNKQALKSHKTKAHKIE